MATTTTGSPATGVATGKSTSARIVIGIFLVLGVMGSGVLVVMIFGSVSGQEFSPAGFRRRTFQYYRIPLIGLQVSPIWRTPSTNELERHLSAARLIPPPAQPATRWDLVEVQAAIKYHAGDALLLTRYLDTPTDEDELAWLTWTEEHPELAAVLWPAVADTTRRGNYVVVPDLMRLAQQAQQADSFQAEVEQLLEQTKSDPTDGS